MSARSLSTDARGVVLYPYDAALHAPGTKAARGLCGQHGEDSCDATPVVSFRDHQGHRQAGCDRLRQELQARGATESGTPPDDWDQ